MSNVSPSRVMAGVTAGYLLGRTKKLKLALIVGSAIANRKLLSGQVDKLSDAAGVGPLGQQLVSAGRKAAIGAVSSRIDSFSDKLAERTDALNGSDSDEDEEEDEEEESEDEDEYDEPAEDEEEEEPADDEDEYDEPAEDEEEEEPADDEDEYDEPAEEEEVEPVDEEEELAEDEDEYEEPADDEEEFDEDEEATA
jgi:hypothetical protein